ncbi:TIGR01906 family membrane protein [Schnuerera sp. xch1]|uniref:TIGR01906 family membrane protein n=1 Tax=Schnuerera sp. xch1 TaxID=2874283 RepID=UPI001CBB8329|nr:TIGR01906 family membrane protein [Schnuerera sp. xch1]MBZ2173655.1 TIGR01906 family membrane protein [Schnuerera sp. xch1]
MNKLLTIIILIFLPVFFLLKSVEINTFNKGFYLESFQKYDVIETTDMDLQDLSNITDNLFSYLKDESDETILKSNFNEREILHMKDVKKLFKYGFILKNTLFILSLFAIIILIANKDSKSMGKRIFYGTFVWWGLITLIFVLITINFNKCFTYFHLIFFDNDLWVLNPNTDLLIQMLPQKFFIDIFQNIVLLFLGLLVILQVIGYIFMKKGKDNKWKSY